LAKCDKKSLLHLKSKFGLGSLASKIQNFTTDTSESIFGHLIGLLGLGISPSHVHYLRKVTQYRETGTHINASIGIRYHDPCVRDGEDIMFLRQRGHCDRHYLYCYIYLVQKNFSILTYIYKKN
jgi:hypothetical protein